MKAAYFIYSEKQRAIQLDYEPGKQVNEVFISGKFFSYTECNATGDSNWDDAISLGIHPDYWVRVDGVIQDDDLADFLKGKGV